MIYNALQQPPSQSTNIRAHNIDIFATLSIFEYNNSYFFCSYANGWYIYPRNVQIKIIHTYTFTCSPPYFSTRHLSKNSVLASLGALQDTLNDPQHIAGLLRLDGNVLGLSAHQGIGELAVKGAVRLGLELGDRHLAGLAGGLVHGGQAAVGSALNSVSGVCGLSAGAQLVLLRVEVELAKAALCAADPVAQLGRLGAEGADVDVDQQAVVVEELRGDGVRGLELGAALALVQQAAADGLGQAEEHVGLVDEVRAQVEEGAAAVGDAQLALPVGGRVGAVAVKVGVELDDAAELALLDEVLGEQEIGVPAAVLVHADELARLGGDVGQLLGLGGRGHEGLLGEDVLAGLKRALGQVEVVVGRGGDDDDVNFGVGDEGERVCVVLEGRVVGRGGVVCLGGALDDGVQGEGGGCDDEGDVEDFGGETGRRDVVLAELLLVVGWLSCDLPVAYDTDVEDFAGHCDAVMLCCCGIMGEEYGRGKDELWVLDTVCQRKLKIVEGKMDIYISANSPLL